MIGWGCMRGEKAGDRVGIQAAASKSKSARSLAIAN